MNERYPTGLRNKAVISLMLHCGLRVSEVLSLRPGSINLTKGKLRIESGKGAKDQDLAIPEYMTDLLDSWGKKRLTGNYFFSTLEGKKLSVRYLQQIIKRYGQKAEINKNISLIPCAIHMPPGINARQKISKPSAAYSATQTSAPQQYTSPSPTSMSKPA